MTSRLQHARAFTLLELVVAMAIISLVVGGLYASLRSGFRVQTSVNQTIEPLQRAGIAADFLVRDLESALPPTGTLASQFVGTPGKDDRGNDSDDILLDAAVNGPTDVQPVADIRQIEYTVESESGDHRLVRRVTSNLLAPVTPDPDEEILCRGVRAFRLRYYESAESDTWYDSWDSTGTTSSIGAQQTKALPLAVELHLELDPVTPNGPVVEITRLIQLPCSVPAASSTAGGAP